MIRSESSTLQQIGDITAPKGSLLWCIGIRDQAVSVLMDTKSTREHARRTIQALKEDDRFRTLADADGHPFLSWEFFCAARPPYGFGMTADEVEALIDAKPLAQKLAADPGVKPLAEHGTNQHEERTLHGNVQTRGNDTAYLVRRLKRDAPEIAEALARGEYPSARAAAIAAGIIRVPTVLDVLTKAWSKATQEERRQFLQTVCEQGV